MDKGLIKKDLFLKLKKCHCFWSYEPNSITDISDDLLIEMVMLHLDIVDINKLFYLYPYERIKDCWIRKLIPQRDYIYSLNKFIAWYYFGIKKPGAYVKAMATRQLNKISI